MNILKYGSVKNVHVGITISEYRIKNSLISIFSFDNDCLILKMNLSHVFK